MQSLVIGSVVRRIRLCVRGGESEQREDRMSNLSYMLRLCDATASEVGSMRGSRRKTAKSVLRVVEDRAGVPDEGRPALLYTPWKSGLRSGNDDGTGDGHLRIQGKSNPRTGKVKSPFREGGLPLKGRANPP